MAELPGSPVCRERAPSRLLPGAVALAVAGAVVAAGLPFAAPARAATAEVYVVPPSRVLDLVGRGFGHGHGMSQYGAQGRAASGQSANQMMSFYYPTTSSQTRDNANLRVILTNSGAEGIAPSSGNTSRRYQCDFAATGSAHCGDAVVQVVPQPGLQARSRAAGATWTTLPQRLGGNPVSVWSVRRVDSSTSLRLRGLTSAGWLPWGVHSASGFALHRSGSTTRLRYADGSRVDYPGQILLRLTSATTLARIDLVPIESYLRGVVPREMPASWHAAALRAQAIAARTYATYDQQHAASGSVWDTCDSTYCQMYRGLHATSAYGTVTSAEPSSDAAIAATAGRIRTYGGSAAFTQFSASNGNWSVAGTVPYLQAAADPYDDYPTWTTSVSAATLQHIYPSLGYLERFVVAARDGNGQWGGRVLSIRLEGEKNATPTSVTLTGDTLRGLLGLRSTYLTVADPTTDPHSAFGAATRTAGSGTLVSRASDGLVLYRSWTAAAGLAAPRLLGALTTTAAPAVVAGANGRLDAVALGPSGHLRMATRASSTASWSAWAQLGGSGRGRPAVVRVGGLLHVFVRGTDDALRQRTQATDGSWSAWQSLSGHVTAGGVSAAATGDGRLHVVVRGDLGVVMTRDWSAADGWSVWSSLGGAVRGTPTAASDTKGRLTVAARWSDGSLRALDVTDGTVGAWSSRGGGVTGAPTALAAPGSARTDVLVNRVGGHLYRITRTSSGWSSWQAVAG
jgi:SpoIID/LytB domain protein